MLERAFQAGYSLLAKQVGTSLLSMLEPTWQAGWNFLGKQVLTYMVSKY
jgi:hypothetical protein